jgi:anti-sigma B factor antagonist
MKIESQMIGKAGLISFSGKMLGEPADSKVFEKKLKDLIEKGIINIILDLGNVQRINSTGLAILITATTLCSNCGGDIVTLVGVNEFIEGALSLTRLNQFFVCYDKLEDALKEVEN